MDWNCGEAADGRAPVWGSDPGSVVVVVEATLEVVVALPLVVCGARSTANGLRSE
jgi:hypothetical protein